MLGFLPPIRLTRFLKIRWSTTTGLNEAGVDDRRRDPSPQSWRPHRSFRARFQREAEFGYYCVEPHFSFEG